MKNYQQKEPRILHLISSSGFLGAENVVLELSKETSKQAIWVTIGILENRNNLHMELADRARQEGMKVQIFPCRGRFDRKTIESIRDFILSQQPNILHSHNYKSNFYALAANRKKSTWVVTNHLWKRTTLALKVYAYLDSLIIRRADKVVAVSEDIANEMTRRGISSEKIHIIDNGINLDRFANKRIYNDRRKSLGLNGTHKIFGTIASLTPEKGQVYLIEAARLVTDKYPECRFFIVGDGGQRELLEEKTAAFGLTKKVNFTGSRKDVPELLHMFDAFVLPSLAEGLPIALLEAMAAKVPVIATRVGAIPQLIEDHVSGLLIQPKDSQAIANAIREVLNDEQRSLEMAEKGFERVRDNYSSAIMARKYLAVYRELLG